MMFLSKFCLITLQNNVVSLSTTIKSVYKPTKRPSVNDETVAKVEKSCKKI